MHDLDPAKLDAWLTREPDWCREADEECPSHGAMTLDEDGEPFCPACIEEDAAERKAELQRDWAEDDYDWR